MTHLATEVAKRVGKNAPDRGRDPKMAMCLSGGGFRAMLFHVGALRRLNEFGLLSVVDRFSSVSGGSMVAAVLALKWQDLRFDSDGISQSFDEVEREVFDLAGHTLDVTSTFSGMLPGNTGAGQLAKRYRKVIGDRTLQDLPSNPRFIFNTTNMATGNLLRWSREYGADHALGRIDAPAVRIAEIVAASAAFPPFLSPMVLPLPAPIVDHNTGVPLPNQPQHLWLTDGGAYDNLGIQTAESFHTVLVSDGGAPFKYRSTVGRSLYSQHRRSVSIIYDQVCRLRIRRFVGELDGQRRLGALWRISTDINDFPANNRLPCSRLATTELANIPTRLSRVPVTLRRRLMNWGYAVADAAVRSYLEPSLEPPNGFPYAGGVG